MISVGAMDTFRTYEIVATSTVLTILRRPEIYSGKNYRFEVDLFAFGVLLFRLLSDQRPFSGNSENVRRKTLELRYEVQGDDWDLVSDPAKDMIRRLLINKDERLTAKQALEHPWMGDMSRSVLRSDGPLSRAHHAGVGRSRSGNAVLRVRSSFGHIFALIFFELLGTSPTRFVRDAWIVQAILGGQFIARRHKYADIYGYFCG